MHLNNFQIEKQNMVFYDRKAMEIFWLDGEQKVAEFKIWKWWDGLNISDLKVYEKYRGNRFSYELLNYAVKKLKAKNLAVEKCNKIAIHIYEKYGFYKTQEDDKFYYMTFGS